jgi:hypothetical protein
MNLYEPATVITDYLLALVGLVFGLLLRRGARPGPGARRWFARALLLSALSAFVGGSYHGLAPNFSPQVAALWWRLTLIILSCVSAALAFSLMYEMAPAPSRKRFRNLILLKFGFFAGLALVQPLFLVAIADYGTALIAWLIVAVVVRRPWRGWMLTAIGLSVLAATVQQLRLSPSAHFNHNDLYHVIQALALAGFYRGGRFLSGSAV